MAQDFENFDQLLERARELVERWETEPRDSDEQGERPPPDTDAEVASEPDEPD